MAKKATVPQGIAEAIDGARGAATAYRWIETLTQEMRESFERSCELFLEKRAEGRTTMSYPEFHALLIEHFDFPFKAMSLRAYLERAHPKLFAKQRRHW